MFEFSANGVGVHTVCSVFCF